jgi:20S proteasome alpha/beta subunit
MSVGIDGAGIAVVGASDRMLTSGDGEIEFEPAQTKITKLTPSIGAMYAGDSALQSEIFNNVIADISAHSLYYPWSVRAVAELYSRSFEQARSERAERAFLRPLNLDRAAVVYHVPTDKARYLADQMQNFTMAEGIETIVAGSDLSGTHLYAVGNFGVACMDGVGFTAIGIGARHALSHLMNMKHTKASGLAETLLRTFTAKKLAEVAPGVGSEATDMFIVGPTLSSFVFVFPHILERLGKIYDTRLEAFKAATQTAEESMAAYVSQIGAAQAAQTAQAGTTPPPKTSGPDADDKGDVSGGPEESEPKA